MHIRMLNLPATGLPANATDLWVDIPTVTDARGGLGFVEAGNTVPFAFKRAYFLYDVAAPRGAHAHLNLRQLFIAFGGSFTLHLDDGTHKHSLTLSNPTRGVVVGPMVWRDVTDVSPNATCLVLASEWYDEADYIRNYDEFINLARKA